MKIDLPFFITQFNLSCRRHHNHTFLFSSILLDINTPHCLRVVGTQRENNVFHFPGRLYFHTTRTRAHTPCSWTSNGISPASETMAFACSSERLWRHKVPESAMNRTLRRGGYWEGGWSFVRFLPVFKVFVFAYFFIHLFFTVVRG